MNRLLQGDVGSGKTAVALCALYMAVKSGYQGAFLAPTEVLAAQNFALLQKYFPNTASRFLRAARPQGKRRPSKRGWHRGRLTSSAARTPCCRRTCSPKTSRCACATNSTASALPSAARWGKRARAPICWSCPPPPFAHSLPHLLRRSGHFRDQGQAQGAFGDRHGHRAAAQVRRYARIHRRTGKAGNQSYFVCPKIEGDEEGSLISVTELFDELKKPPSARAVRPPARQDEGQGKDGDHAGVQG